jgi:orotate phosphoribosyltransferase
MKQLTEENYYCISKLKDEASYFDNWLVTRNIYVPLLDKGPIRQADAYTPHDYTNHSINIYNIISSILLKGIEDSVNIEELFVLDIAVLLHDVYMAMDPEKRGTHSADAREFVIKEQADKRLPFNRDQALCIGDVIFGHSDLKGTDGKTVCKTIEELPQHAEFITGNSGKEINVRYLSALLRLADELDINSKRIHGYKPSDYNINDASRPHWRKCEILRFPKVSSKDRSVIQLIVDNDAVQRDGNEQADIKLLLEVESKIQTELTYLNDKVFLSSDGPSVWGYHKIEINANSGLKESIDKLYGKNISSITHANEELGNGTNPLAPDVLTPQISTKRITIDDLAFEKQLDEWIVNRNLLKSGHFTIEDNTCARDWINTQMLLEIPDYLREITKRFVDKIDTTYNLIGVGQQGTILASAIAVYKRMPFTYIVPNRYKQFHVEPDKAIKINKSHKTLLITDVIVTGSTISKALEELNKSAGLVLDDIYAVFAIFIREPIANPSPIKELAFADKIFALSNNINIELCQKPACFTCIFKERKINLYSNIPLEP